MELNDENSRIFYNIKDDLSKEPNTDNYNYSFYHQLENIKKEMDFALLKNYKEEILKIITKDDFVKKFILILKSPPVFNYFFIKDDDYLSEEQNLNEQYEQFLEDIKIKGYNFLRNLIRIKGLAYIFPSLTGPSMRIFLNPIMEFSDIAIKDDNQRNNILESALIILLLHGFVRFLKFYHVKNCYPKEMPLILKKSENEKCIIFYLFRKKIIKTINNEQATLINDLSSWENAEILRSIFKEKELKYQPKIGELNLYFSNEYNSKSVIKKLKKTEICEL